MAADELFDDLPEDVGAGEVASLLGYLDLGRAVEENVAELLGDLLHVALFDGLYELVALLQEEVLEGVGGLLPVPGAAAGGAECGDELLDSLEGAGEAVVWHCTISPSPQPSPSRERGFVGVPFPFGVFRH